MNLDYGFQNYNKLNNRYLKFYNVQTLWFQSYNQIKSLNIFNF